MNIAFVCAAGVVVGLATGSQLWCGVAIFVAAAIVLLIDG